MKVIKINKKSKPIDIRSSSGFKELYEEYGAYVYAVCRKYIRNKEDCEDITAKIFFSIWERREKIELTGSFRSYLYKAVKQQVYNHFKLERRRAERIQEAAIKLGFFPGAVENEVWYRDFLTQLKQAIEKLPTRRKEVFILVKLENLSIKEVAKRLSLGEPTVSTHLHKALAQLRLDLSDYLQNYRSTVS
ncbi:MAG: RNA polymerase sigma-70 factor [Bacteroidota bacterium]